MSIHDETWDKCPHCKNVIKSWHGDFHESKGCLDYVSWHSYNEELMKNQADIWDSARNNPNSFSQKVEPVRPLPSSPKEETATLPPFYGCDIADPKYHNLTSLEYIPEMWTIEKDLVRGLAFSVEAGLEYAQECLIRHDQELGRTTKKNKSWAEIIERDINYMKAMLERVGKYEKRV